MIIEKGIFRSALNSWLYQELIGMITLSNLNVIAIQSVLKRKKRKKEPLIVQDEKNFHITVLAVRCG